MPMVVDCVEITDNLTMKNLRSEAETAQLKEMKADHKKSLKKHPKGALNSNSDELMAKLSNWSRKLEKFGANFRGLVPSAVVITNSKKHGTIKIGEKYKSDVVLA